MLNAWTGSPSTRSTKLRIARLRSSAFSLISILQFMNVVPTYRGMAAGDSPVLEYSAVFFI
jgi:hypothetical protein